MCSFSKNVFHISSLLFRIYTDKLRFVLVIYPDDLQVYLKLFVILTTVTLIIVNKLYSIVVDPFDIEKRLFIKSVAGIFPNTVAFINNTGSAELIIHIY